MDINVMMDRETGRNKGYAFATFEDLPEHEVSRITGGSWDVDGKVVRHATASIVASVELIRVLQVEIKLAQPRPQRRQDREPQNGSGPSKIGTYTSESPRSLSTAPVSMGGAMGKGAQLPQQPQPQQQQDMSALYQRMMGRMGGMVANSNPGMMYNGAANMNMRNMPGMTNMGMGGMGGMGMNMGGMGMGNPGMMSGAMMPGAMGGGMGMGMNNMNMNPMMRVGGAGAMGGMGFAMNPQAAMGMGGNMMGNPQMQMSAMNMNNMQAGVIGGGGGPALRLGSGPLTTGMGVGGNAGAGMGGGAGRGRGGLGPNRTASRTGHFHPYSR